MHVLLTLCLYRFSQVDQNLTERHIHSRFNISDTAYHYGNEAVIGKVLKEYFAGGKLKREDVFITTKLPYFAHAPEDVEKVVKMQLEALQVDYIDLYLIHGPVPFKREKDSFALVFENDMQVPATIDHLDTWRAMEKLHDEGKLKALGLSNFNVKQLQNVYDHARIKPANLQNFLKTSIADTLLNGDPLTDPVVKELAAKYKKTAAQILLRYIVQQDVVAIPKTVKPER
ncbi:unnamed protein product [Strongylus vulgaris]|uniref:NADP-dependent oxidoreductase domain-containing protein n=1 Tax=Strongylus vulgaris TaxID=40348 RepID=A0A3P7L1W4_STRVU|nr:unnamed protein product [Strongylus vulgaris]